MWNDKKGEIVLLDENETYMTNLLNCICSLKHKTTTYKYAMVKCILDNIFNVNEKYELNFDYLESTFIELYWNLIVEYALPQKVASSQGNKSTIEIIIEDIIKLYPECANTRFENLKKEVKDAYERKARKLLSKDVVGALYSDLNCKIYGFDKETRKIWFNENSYEFILQNKIVIEKINYYSWIIWTENVLEKINKSASNIGIKIDRATKRKSLELFKKKLLIDCSENKCFYCGKEITFNNCHVDHFIPWAFVKDDKLWNLVQSCNNCNLSKKEKIPGIEYLDKIIQRNQKISLQNDNTKLNKLYNSSLENGFILWK